MRDDRRDGGRSKNPDGTFDLQEQRPERGRWRNSEPTSAFDVLLLFGETQISVNARVPSPSTVKSVYPEILRSGAVVVLQDATEPFTTFDLASNRAGFLTWLNDLVVEPLMISFLVIMRQEFGAGVSQQPLTEKDHSVEAL